MPPRGRNLPQRTRGNRALQRGRQANPPNPNPQNNVQPRPTGAQPPLNNAGNGAVAGAMRILLSVFEFDKLFLKCF